MSKQPLAPRSLFAPITSPMPKRSVVMVVEDAKTVDARVANGVEKWERDPSTGSIDLTAVMSDVPKAKAGRPKKVEGEPWVAEGVSRRTWYRRQKVAKP